MIKSGNYEFETNKAVKRAKRSKVMYIFLTFVALIFIMIAYIFYQVNFTRAEHVTFKTPKLNGNPPIKIMQLTDFHDMRSGIMQNIILKSVSELEPDVIVITGDLIDDHSGGYDNVYNFVEKILKMNPEVNFVSGNHEWRKGSIDKLISGLRTRGVKIINNICRRVDINGTKINICGLDDFYNKKYKFSKDFEGADKELFTVLLSHSPDIVFANRNIPADLILSGHTHGGQVRLPFIGALIAPGQGFFPKYSKGLYQISEKTSLYIDSGAGVSTFPVRFLNRSQISLIRIEGEE
jgi:predicted MPP superfamily phosphohydrolase